MAEPQAVGHTGDATVIWAEGIGSVFILYLQSEVGFGYYPLSQRA